MTRKAVINVIMTCTQSQTCKVIIKLLLSGERWSDHLVKLIVPVAGR